MASKSLDKATNDAVRAFAKKVIDSDFGGVLSDASKKTGIAYGLLYEFMKGKRGLGLQSIHKLSVYSGVDVQDIISGTAPKAARDLREFLITHVNDTDLAIEILRNPSGFSLQEIVTADDQAHHEEFKHLTPRQRLEAARTILSEGPSEGGVSQLNRMITDSAPSQPKGLSTKRAKK